MQCRQQTPFARRTIRWHQGLARIRHRLHGLSPVPLLCAVLTVPGAAQDIERLELEPIEPPAPRYTVEVILFTYGDGVATGNERFPRDDGQEPAPGADGNEDPELVDSREAEFGDRPRPDDTVLRAEPAGDPVADPLAEPLADPAAETGPEPGSGSLEPLALPAAIQLAVLPREQLTLTDAFDTLTELDAYRPVAWTGWTQAVYESDVTPAIRLRRLARVPLAFDGTLKLFLSRYLHLEVDVAMEDRQGSAPQPAYNGREPDYGDARWPEPVARSAGAVHYRIRENRIVKNGDLRYFDHPKFGLLARITRVTDNAEADGTDAPLLPPEPAGNE